MQASEDNSVSIFEGYLTKQQLAEQLGKSQRTIDRWTLSGHAPAPTRVGNTVVYRRETVLEWLKSQEVKVAHVVRKNGGAR